MPNTLQDPTVAAELDRMYTESKNQMSKLRDMGERLGRPMTAQERTEALSEFYIPVTRESGRLLYSLAELDGPVDFVLLDGWKDLYLPVLELLEPRLSGGVLVVADNASAPDMKPYLDYVRSPDNGYVSFNFPARESDSVEVSCRTGD
jgi:predicted O-methyltransferase YrrM